MRQVRVRQGGKLGAALAHQSGAVLVGEPPVLHRPLVQLSPRIGSRDRNLNGVRVHFPGEADRLLYGLPGLSRQSEYEGPVDGDPQIPAVTGETSRPVDPQALLDVVEYLLVTGLIADK